MKTSKQRPKQSSRLIPAQRKDRSLSVKDNRPESAAQTQLFAAVRSGQPSPLVSLVGQGRASHSPAMIQKKGVVQREGWTDKLTIPCANKETAITLKILICQSKEWTNLMNILKQQAIKIDSIIADNGLSLIFSGEQAPDLSLFQAAINDIVTFATPLNKQPIPSYGEDNKEEIISKTKKTEKKIEDDTPFEHPHIMGQSMGSSYAKMLVSYPQQEKQSDVPLLNYMLKDTPSDEIMQDYKKTTVKNTNYTAKGLLTEDDVQIGSSQKTSPQLPVKEKESSTLYLVGQGLFAVGTGEEFPGGFFTDGAGPCVAIAIKCENGVFALGHFDSDLNGEKVPYDEKKIDEAIQRLYNLMEAKSPLKKFGKVDVLLTRGDTWDKDLLNLYKKSINKYFGGANILIGEKQFAHVSKKEQPMTKEMYDVYTKSLKYKISDKNSIFMANLHTQSPQFNSEGINSLIKLVTDLTFHTGENVQEIIPKNVNYVLNIVTHVGFEDLQHDGVAGLDALHKEAEKEIDPKRRELVGHIDKLTYFIKNEGSVQFFELKEIITEIQINIQHIQVWLFLIKKKFLKYQNISLSEKITENINKINASLEKADVALAEANVALAKAVENLKKAEVLAKKAKEAKKKNVVTKKPTNVFLPPKLKK